MTEYPNNRNILEKPNDMDLVTIQVIENRGQKFELKTGVNAELATAWVNTISTEEEVLRWTADHRKRAKPDDILKRNKPDGDKNMVTYSLWTPENKLAAVSWYQIWKPGEEEQRNISVYCTEQKIKDPTILTSAFRIAKDYRGQGLATKIVKATESHYPEYLLKYKNLNNILFTLETDEKNEAAVRTYVKNGYQTIGMFEQPDKESYRGKRLLMAKKH